MSDNVTLILCLNNPLFNIIHLFIRSSNEFEHQIAKNIIK